MTRPNLTIRIDAANIPAIRDFIERVEDIAGIPDDANVWDATGLAQEALEELHAAVNGTDDA